MRSLDNWPSGGLRDQDMGIPEPTDIQIEAAAKAWMTWQFPGRSWEDAIPVMQDRFRDGARRALRAAAIAFVENAHEDKP